MNDLTRRDLLKLSGTAVVSAMVSDSLPADESNVHPSEMILKDGWFLQSSALVDKRGEVISSSGFTPEGWQKTSVPSTVLNALIKNGVYPDPRLALNSYRIPDSSDEFNQKFDLAKYSHLPDKRNPWKDPYWYRTEFKIPENMRGKRVWLLFKGINYRADVWFNGRQIADRETMVGMYQRFHLEGGLCQAGMNYLAVRVYPVDHPGIPDPQLTVLGPARSFVQKDITKDVTYSMSVGYDCMLPQPGRDLGLWHGVSLRFTGPVDIRNPFVITDLPLPNTRPAFLTISAELVNATASPQSGVLQGSIPDAGVTFEQTVALGPRETREVSFSSEAFPQLAITNPKLWWPTGLGEQPLYELSLVFRIRGTVSDKETTTFGIRKVTKELYIHEKWPGLRVYINGQKVFSRGGWIQPDLLFDWDKKRMEAEVRYFAQANLNTVTFEDLPMPSDEFLDACDRHGILFWNCFYGSLWASPTGAFEEVVQSPGQPPSYRQNPFTMPYAKTLLPEQYRNHPLDHDLLERCTVDILKRYRNHPSLILYSCMGEGNPGRDVYQRWRKQVRALDPTRISTISMDLKNRLPWLDEDWPTGLDDANGSLPEELKQYYEYVRAGGEWMFSTEIPFSPSLPSVESLRRFIPDLWETQGGSSFPLNSTWAHHGANHYFRPYDSLLRRQYGEPENVEDYCMKAHLVTADHHRAVSEAVNHRLWDITSGSLEWKINSSFPDVQWQIHDWYLRPAVSLYYYRLAFEPLHIQYSYLDRMITVVNQTLQPQNNLEALVQMYDFNGKLLWEKRTTANAAANAYGNLFQVPTIDKVTPVYFLRLQMTDNAGKVISRNFYWLSTTAQADFKGLADLPAVKLESTSSTEKKDREAVTKVILKNPTDHIAFFIHVALLQGNNGEEVLPVRWDDNYFSLLPGESREVSADYAIEDLNGAAPAIEVSGWNVLGPFDCAALKVSPLRSKIGELIDLTANISNTGLDGSLVQLIVDEKPTASKRLWARGDRTREVSFQLSFETPGTRVVQIGKQSASITITG